MMCIESASRSRAEQPFSPITANIDNTVLASMLAGLRAGLLANIMRFLDSESEGKQLQSLEAQVASKATDSTELKIKGTEPSFDDLLVDLLEQDTRSEANRLTQTS